MSLLGENPWEKTKVPCLYRNKHSGRYYGRFKIRGKHKWVSLDTDVFSVAKLRIGDEAATIDRQRVATINVTSGKATMGELIEIHQTRIEANPDYRPNTIHAHQVSIKKLRKTWTGIEDLQPRQITPRAIWDWATKFKNGNASYVPPGAKKALKGNSPASVNRAIDTLRRVLDIAVERGQIHANPALVKPPTGRLKKKIVPKKLVLPNRKDIARLLAAMEAIPGWGRESADLFRFMMYSGARIGEVPETTWKDVHWERKTLHLPGYKTETSDRFIPLFADLEAFLKRLIKRRKEVAKTRADKDTFLKPTDSILRIRECQRTIDAACRATKVQRITHHDVRHLFATIVIESGVDLPTLSRWLGHNDGGVLAAKTYGHLRPEHSQQSAKKVRF